MRFQRMNSQPLNMPAETAVNVLALIKGEERYIWIYSDSERVETLRSLGRFASNQELSFTWYDAAVLSQKIRETIGGNEK